MSTTTTAAEASLINDTEFLEELERLEHAAEHAPDPGLASPTYADAFDALDRGMPMNRAAPGAPHDEHALIDDPYQPDAEQPAPAEKPIPFVAAALVLVACLTAGAATAAFLFHDQVTIITALRTATR